MTERSPEPHEIRYHSRSRVLEVSFADGRCFELSAYRLRAREEAAPATTSAVGIARIAPLGAGGIELHFDDGHVSSPLSWTELYQLGAGAPGPTT